MNMSRKAGPLVSIAAVALLALGACASPSTPAPPDTTDPAGPADSTESGATQPEDQTPTDEVEETDETESVAPDDNAGADAAEGCWLELFDGDNFDQGDDHFKLTEPGEYADLASLPGADQDWTDEADSLKVSPGAQVTIWTEPSFAGSQQDLEPGSEHPDVDDVYSLKMSCQ